MKKRGKGQKGAKKAGRKFSLPGLPKKSDFYECRLLRDSAHKMPSILQMDKNRERASRFLYIKREKSFYMGTFFVGVLRSQNTACRKNVRFFDSLKAGRKFSLPFCDAVCEPTPASITSAGLPKKMKGGNIKIMKNSSYIAITCKSSIPEKGTYVVSKL